jgi:thioesterase domain-containing protein
MRGDGEQTPAANALAIVGMERPAGVIDASSPNTNGGPTRERSQPVGRSYRSLVNIRRGGGLVPFFCVHGAGGNILNFRDLASGVDPRQPFFGLQAYGIDGVTPPHETIEEMARAYLEEVRDVQPHGPYLLGGYSGGGVVAFEMAQQLTNEGQEVRLLAFIDTFHPELVLRSHPMGERLARLREGGTAYVAEVLKRRRDAIRLAHHLRVKERHRDAKEPIPLALRGLHLTRNFEMAISRYRAKKWAGRATLFRAEQLAHLYSGRGPRYGWERDILSGVELVVVPGNHRTILRGANAAALLGVLNAAISRAQSGSPPTAPITAAAPQGAALAVR